MPVSSKRIISYINKTNTSFTAFNIAKESLSSKSTKKPKSDRKKKNRASDEKVILSKIKNILDALTAIGYLKRQRKSYIKARGFKIEGNIKINTTGNGILTTDDGDEIIIWKENINNSHNNDLVEIEIIDFRDRLYYGSVRKIIQRRRDEYFASVTKVYPERIVFRLMDTPGEVDVYSDKDKNEFRPGDCAVVGLLDDFDRGRQKCEVRKRYLPDEEYDVRRIIIKHSLPSPHPEYKELIDIENKIPRGELSGRKNYRGLFTITIDGEHAKDFDDAISLDVLPDGYRLYVHIADVSAYVKKGGELDKEAGKRGTSFYLANQVIPMLPEILSNNLCSLRQGEDKLTLSAEIVFDKKGKEISKQFHRGIINVNKRLTYKSAEEIINNDDNDLHPLLSRMCELAGILKRGRLKKGRIDLSLLDYELVFDGNKIKDIIFAKRLKSQMVIEEFMLSANEVVSRALTENDVKSLYRIHENISEEKLLSLKNFLKTLGFNLAAKTNIGIALQRIIDSVSGKKFEQVVNFIMLKSFMQAYYGPEPLGHFGLGFADYTHFTSPIRRYPDLVVHRCLKSLLDKTPPPYEFTELEIIGDRSSEMERVAQNAERDLFKLICCRYMENKIGQVFDAVISGMSKGGFFVTLIDIPVEGMVPLRLLTDDYYLINEDDYTVIGKRLGRRFRLGDALKVELKEVSVDLIRIDFDVVG